MVICDVSKCTGCYACFNICPQNCIKLIPNEIGHLVPEINNDKCINCGLCRKICPNNSLVKLSYPLKAYACWSLDKNGRNTSASGGAASVFSNYILKNNGVVYGAALKNMLICHVRIDRNQDLYMLKGSKYVQSDIGDTYKLAKKDLINNKNVLFVGTPCQIAGLKNYLAYDYKNLITADIICHGVPSQQLLKEHIKSVICELNFDEISFRKNNKYCLNISNNKNIIYDKNLYNDLFLTGFIKGLFYRESCYACRYATSNRVSDITIGDFWGIGKLKPFIKPINEGVSLLLPITQKGLSLINNCKNYLFLEEREIIEAVKGNTQLIHPSNKHKNAEKFKASYNKKGFNKAARKCLRIQRIKYMILRIMIKVKG